MYTGVCGQVIVDGELPTEFSLAAGVLQGCPASSLVSSLYMDCLEAFVTEAIS